MPSVTQITPPRVDFLDPRTGKISREWFRFFLSLFTITSLDDGNTTTIRDLIDAIDRLQLRSTATALEGDPGEDGERGFPGPQGLQGLQGLPGMPGMDGQDADELALLGWPNPPHSTYGEMTITANATGTVLTLQNTFYQQTAGWVTGEVDDFTFSGGTLTARRGGNFYMSCVFTIADDAANQTYTVGIFHSGVLIVEHSTRFKLNNATDIFSTGLSGILGNIVVGDTFDLRIMNETSAGKTITISESNFSLFRI